MELTFLKKITKNSTALTFVVIVLVLGISILFMVWKSSQVQKKEGFSGDIKSLDGSIFVLERRIKDEPETLTPFIDLSQAYMQKIRETADASLYKRVEEILDSAEKKYPNNADIYAARAEVELGRHNFKSSYELIQQAIVLNPARARYYGVAGDAEIELGLYEKAVTSFQKMVDLRPDYSSYIRISYLRELNGDIAGAIEMLGFAISAGSGSKENIAFAYVERSKLFMRDDLSKAAEDLNFALALIPEYPPALEALGKISFFKKDYLLAEKYFKKAYEKLPIAQYATDLADLYLATGRNVEAKQYIVLAQIAFEGAEKSGVNTDLEESIFLSDHGLNLEESLEKARRAHIERPSVYAADALSWALFQKGSYKEASELSSQVFKLGKTDPLILFHQGMIAHAQEKDALAKEYLESALKIHPHFSILYSQIAVETLESIRNNIQ